MNRLHFIKASAMGMASTVFLKFPASGKKTKSNQSDHMLYKKTMSQGNNPDLVLYAQIDKDKSEFEYITLQYANGKVKCNLYLDKVNTLIENINSDVFYYEVKLDLENGGCGELELYSQESVDIYNNILKTKYCKEKYGEYLIMENDDTEQIAYLSITNLDSNNDDDYDFEDCFLTTACTQYKGLPDDCSELQKLRTFRDNYMLKQPEGKALVKEYYRVAPAIVEKLAKEDNAAVYDFIYDELVIKSIHLIEKGEPDMAMYYYKAFTQQLQHMVL